MKKYLFLCLTAGLLAGSAHSVTLAPGTMETRLAGQLDPTTADGTQVDLNFSWGYFFADNAQAGGRLSFLNSDHVTLAGAAAFAEYNFDLGGEDWLPFVEGSLGLMSGDLPTGDVEFSPEFLLGGFAHLGLPVDRVCAAVVPTMVASVGGRSNQTREPRTPRSACRIQRR